MRVWDQLFSLIPTVSCYRMYSRLVVTAAAIPVAATIIVTASVAVVVLALRRR